MKAICWDMDGSLIDNHLTFEKAVVFTNAKYDLSYTKEYPVGGCMETLWSCLNNPHNVPFKRWWEEIRDLCTQDLSKESLRPYVKEILNFFEENRLSQSCVSNSPSSTIENNLSKTQIIDFFAHWVGRDQVKEGKPSPEPYVRSCTIHGISPAHALAIEDSKVGIQSAKEAGLKVVAFPHESSQFLDWSQADYVISDLRELKKILVELS
jgi:beta-phosphoglucomutase-like phosphatase (HAD superfamily)